MEKLISVINDNIRSIISGIKINAADIEKNLKSVIAQMDDLVRVANDYKEDVENSKQNIENLESEINQLENDLEELQTKFGSRDFGELLAAGNKEISTKIIEKRAMISKVSEHIIDITEQAHKLKEDLLRLKEQKTSLEQSLSDANTVKKYYDVRLTEVIDYAEDHNTDLNKFVEDKPSEQLLADAELDSEEIRENVDGRVFEEIDEISAIEPSQELIEAAMKVQKTKKVEEDIDLSMTQKLDDIILTANEVLAETENMRMENAEMDIPIEEDTETDAESDYVEEEATYEIFGGTSKFEDSEDSEDNDDILGFNLDDIAKEAGQIDVSNEENEAIDDEAGFSLENLFSNDDSTQPIDLEGLNMELPEFGVKEVDPTSFYTSETNLGIASSFAKYGLDSSNISENELKELEDKYSSNEFDELMDVIGKHSLNPATIYGSMNVILNFDVNSMDRILNALENTGANASDIELVFNVFDKVNVDKLEKNVKKNPEQEITKLLFNSMEKVKTNEEIVEALDLNGVENQILKNSSSSDEYDRICIFSNLVKKNYETLDSYDIDITKECFVKHPHRFLINPTDFTEILDKYDPEDLVRCINKNIAVIDKL